MVLIPLASVNNFAELFPCFFHSCIRSCDEILYYGVHIAIKLTDGIFVIDLECKRRWTGLREKYRREKILNYKQRRLGQVVDITQRWRNYVNMMFLDQVYTPRGYNSVFAFIRFHFILYCCHSGIVQLVCIIGGLTGK